MNTLLFTHHVCFPAVPCGCKGTIVCSFALCCRPFALAELAWFSLAQGVRRMLREGGGRAGYPLVVAREKDPRAVAMGYPSPTVVNGGSNVRSVTSTAKVKPPAYWSMRVPVVEIQA